MATGEVLAFWLVALVLIVVPGADWAFTIGATARGGSVLPAVSGLVLGYAGLTVIVAAGVGALVAASPRLLTALTVLGGLYLVGHGIGTARRPPEVRSDVLPSGRGLVLRGIGVSGLNPKGLLVFLALLPQFTRTGAALPVAGQVGVLGLVFVATCALFYLALGLTARSVLRSRPSVARVLGRVSGSAMVVIGVLLIVERLS